jgi:hypothetical protein
LRTAALLRAGAAATDRDHRDRGDGPGDDRHEDRPGRSRQPATLATSAGR